MLKINYTKLNYCPENQLTKKNETDAGWDLTSAETTLVLPYKDLEYTYDLIKIKDLKTFEKFLSLNMNGFILIEPNIEDLIYIIQKLNLNKYKDIKFEFIFNLEKDKNISDNPTEKEYETAKGSHSNALLFDGTDQMTPTYIYKQIEQLNLLKYQEEKLYSLDNLLIESYGLLLNVNQNNYENILSLTSYNKFSIFIANKKYKPIMIPTGIQINAEELTRFDVRLRSSMIKKGITMAHGLGTIDYLYNNEIFIPVYAIDYPCLIEKGERIAQLIPAVQLNAKFIEQTNTEFLNSGRQGFGSTGKN